MKKNIYTSNINVIHHTYWNIYIKLLKKIKFSKDEKILDAGCGEGKLADYLKGFNLYGFDSSEIAIKKAKKKGYKKLHKVSIYDTDFKDKEFDKAICIQVFTYLLEPKKAFKELLRLTKKEIIITAPNFNWIKVKTFFSKKLRKSHSKELKLYSNFTNSDFFKKLAEDNNLKVEIFYLSNKFNFIRNIFGNHLASEVIGIFKLRN